ncbi:insulin-like peptide INSL5 [Amia ocellicauda]|uniref:insulin-like peptide INSL5 n=1 Tax=Amia ocellicauda TaxID=2972642 RepID=UPI003464D686
MRAVILPVLLLLALSAIAQVQGEVKVVKLCGREFIRAVIYTCGGSRWRRVPSERELAGPDGEDVDSQEVPPYRAPDEPDRTLQARRDLNQLLTTACCQWGCNKKDLSTLC